MSAAGKLSEVHSSGFSTVDYHLSGIPLKWNSSTIPTEIPLKWKFHLSETDIQIPEIFLLNKQNLKKNRACGAIFTY